MKSFGDFINEAINVPEARDHDSHFNQVIAESMRLTTQAHVWHLMTKSYASHEAIGSFYEALTSHTDSLAEKYTATGGKLVGQFNHVIQNKYDRVDVLNQLTVYRQLISDVIGSIEPSSLEGIKDELIAIQKLIDQTAYLLDLN